MIILIIRQYFAECVFVLIVDSLLPKAFHILHILCGGLFTAVKEINFSTTYTLKPISRGFLPL